MAAGCLPRAAAGVALVLVCAMAWASDAAAQRTIGCQNRDLSAGPCRSGGSGGGGAPPQIYVPPPPSPRQLADEAVREGDAHYRSREEKDRAIAAYRRALSYLPNDREIDLKLRRALAFWELQGAREERDLDRAVARLREAARIHPENGDYYRKQITLRSETHVRDRAHAYRQANDFAAAARVYRQGSPFLPRGRFEAEALDVEAAGFRHRGDGLWNKGDYRGAIAAYGRAIASYEALLKRKPMEYTRKQLAAAKAAQAEAKAAQANDEGRAAMKKADYGAAIKSFEEALRHDPNSAAAKKNLLAAKTRRETSGAQSYYAAKDYDSAIAKYEEALRQNPNSEYAKKMIQQVRATKANEQGRVSFAAGDYAAAVRSFEDAAKLRPDDPALAENVRKAKVARATHEGEALMRRGERKLALEAFKRALAIDPNDPRAAAKLAEGESVRGVVNGQIDGVRHQALSTVSAAVGRTSRALDEARAAAELSGTPGTALVFDTVAKWVRKADPAGLSGDASVVAVPSKTWAPAPPERESKQMAALRGKIDRLEKEAKSAAAQREKETDPVKKVELKQAEFQREYEREILIKQYTNYAPLTASPVDDPPDVAPSSGAQPMRTLTTVPPTPVPASRVAPSARASPVASSRE